MPSAIEPPNWSEIESHQEFTGLEPEQKQAVFQKWKDMTLAHANEQADFDPASLQRFLGWAEVKNARFANPDLDPRQYLEQFQQEKEDQAGETAKALELVGAEKQKHAAVVSGFNPLNWPHAGKLIDQYRESGSKIDELLPEVGEERADKAREAYEVLNGKKDIAVLDDRIFVKPELSLDRAKYVSLVNKADATPEAKAQAIAAMGQVRDLTANKVLDSLRDADFSTFKEFEAKNPNLAPADLLVAWDKEAKSHPWRSWWDNVKLGAFEGAARVVYGTHYGLKGLITGDEDAIRMARATEDVTGAMAQARRQMPGSVLGGGVAMGTELLPALIPGGVVARGAEALGASATAATRLATAAGASYFGAQTAAQSFPARYAEIYNSTPDTQPADKRHEAAYQGAAYDAIAKGLETALIMSLVGPHGLNPAAVFKKEAAEAVTGTLGSIPKQFFKEGAIGASQVGLDSFLQNVYDAANHPERSVGDAVKDSVEAGLTAGVFGGFLSGGKATVDFYAARQRASANPVVQDLRQRAANPAIAAASPAAAEALQRAAESAEANALDQEVAAAQQQTQDLLTNASQTGQVPSSNQLQHSGANEVRPAAEPVSSNSNAGGGNAPAPAAQTAPQEPVTPNVISQTPPVTVAPAVQAVAPAPAQVSPQVPAKPPVEAAPSGKVVKPAQAPVTAPPHSTEPSAEPTSHEKQLIADMKSTQARYEAAHAAWYKAVAEHRAPEDIEDLHNEFNGAAANHAQAVREYQFFKARTAPQTQRARMAETRNAWDFPAPAKVEVSAGETPALARAREFNNIPTVPVPAEDLPAALEHGVKGGTPVKGSASPFVAVLPAATVFDEKMPALGSKPVQGPVVYKEKHASLGKSRPFEEVQDPGLSAEIKRVQEQVATGNNTPEEAKKLTASLAELRKRATLYRDPQTGEWFREGSGKPYQVTKDGLVHTIVENGLVPETDPETIKRAEAARPAPSFPQTETPTLAANAIIGRVLVDTSSPGAAEEAIKLSAQHPHTTFELVHPDGSISEVRNGDVVVPPKVEGVKTEPEAPDTTPIHEAKPLEPGTKLRQGQRVEGQYEGKNFTGNVWEIGDGTATVLLHEPIASTQLEGPPTKRQALLGGGVRPEGQPTTVVAPQRIRPDGTREPLVQTGFTPEAPVRSVKVAVDANNKVLSEKFARPKAPETVERKSGEAEEAKPETQKLSAAERKRIADERTAKLESKLQAEEEAAKTKPSITEPSTYDKLKNDVILTGRTPDIEELKRKVAGTKQQVENLAKDLKGVAETIYPPEVHHGKDGSVAHADGTPLPYVAREDGTMERPLFTNDPDITARQIDQGWQVKVPTTVHSINPSIELDANRNVIKVKGTKFGDIQRVGEWTKAWRKSSKFREQSDRQTESESRYAEKLQNANKGLYSLPEAPNEAATLTKYIKAFQKMGGGDAADIAQMKVLAHLRAKKFAAELAALERDRGGKRDYSAVYRRIKNELHLRPQEAEDFYSAIRNLHKKADKLPEAGAFYKEASAILEKRQARKANSGKALSDQDIAEADAAKAAEDLVDEEGNPIVPDTSTDEEFAANREGYDPEAVNAGEEGATNEEGHDPHFEARIDHAIRMYFQDLPVMRDALLEANAGQRNAAMEALDKMQEALKGRVEDVYRKTFLELAHDITEKDLSPGDYQIVKSIEANAENLQGRELGAKRVDLTRVLSSDNNPDEKQIYADRLNRGLYVPDRLDRRIIDGIGQTRDGRDILAAEGVAARSSLTIPASEGREPTNLPAGPRRQEALQRIGRKLTELQSKALEAWAKENGRWVDDADFTQKWEAQGQPGGAEAEVYYNQDDGRWYKRNGFSYHTNPLEFLQRVAAHNFLFPETPLRLEGFTEHEGKIAAILSQKHIAAERGANLTEVHELLESRGGHEVSREGNLGGPEFEFPDLGLQVQDLHDENVLAVRGIDGETHPVAIDPVIYLDPNSKQERLRKWFGEGEGDVLGAKESLMRDRAYKPFDLAVDPLDVAHELTPPGYTIVPGERAGDPGRPLWINTKEPDIIHVNPAALAAHIDGLNDYHARNVIDKMLDEERAHIRIEAGLTPEDHAAIHASLPQSEIERLAKAYAPEDVKGFMTDKRAVASEYLRETYQRATSGASTEDTLAFAKGNPGMLKVLLNYFKRMWVALKTRLQIADNPLLRKALAGVEKFGSRVEQEARILGVKEADLGPDITEDGWLTPKGEFFAADLRGGGGGGEFDNMGGHESSALGWLEENNPKLHAELTHALERRGSDDRQQRVREFMFKNNFVRVVNDISKLYFEGHANKDQLDVLHRSAILGEQSLVHDAGKKSRTLYVPPGDRELGATKAPWFRRQEGGMGYRSGTLLDKSYKWDPEAYELKEEKDNKIQAAQMNLNSMAKALHSAARKNFGSLKAAPVDTLNKALGNIDNRFTDAQWKQYQSNKLRLTRSAQGTFLAEMAAANREPDPAQRALMAQDAKEKLQNTTAQIEAAGAAHLTNLRRANLAQARADQANALASLPQETRAAIQGYRDAIDGLSQQLRDSGMISDKLKATIDQNQGLYLHRSYEIFDNPEYKNWIQSADPEATRVRNEALNIIIDGVREARAREIQRGTREDLGQYISLKDARDLATAEIDSTDHELVREAFNDYLSVADKPELDLLKGSIQGKQVNNIVQHRGDIHPAIQRLWGVYDDPLINASKTLFLLKSHMANKEFNSKLFELGTKAGWISNHSAQPDGSNFVRLFDPTDANKAKFGPLAGMYGPELLREALREGFDMQSIRGWQKGLMNLTGYAMSTKTALSVQATIRNFFGNLAFATTGFHVNPIHYKEAVRALKTQFGRGLDFDSGNAKKFLDYNERLIKLGVLSSDVVSNTLRTLLSQAARIPDMGHTMKGRNAFIDTMKRMQESAGNIHQSMDDFWKVVAFESERGRLVKARNAPVQATGESAADFAKRTTEFNEALDKEAAWKVKNTLPTYSQAPKFVQYLRRQPFIAPFITFTSEMWRTTAGTYKVALSELQDSSPKIRRLGAARMGLMTGTLLLLSNTIGNLARMGFKQLNGDKSDSNNDTKQENLSKLVPLWQRDNNLIHLFSEGNKHSYVDLSYLLPHDVVTKPIMLAYEALRDPEAKGLEKLGNAAGAMLHGTVDPYFREQILAGSVVDALRGTDASGSQIYNENDSQGRKAWEAFKHVVGSSLVPGTVLSAQRIARGLESDLGHPVMDGSGRTYTTWNELLSLLGTKIMAVDTGTALEQRAAMAARKVSEAGGYTTHVLKSRGSQSPADIEAGYERTNAARKAALAELRGQYLAAVRLGMPQNEAVAALAASNLGREGLASVVGNIYVRHEPSKEVLGLAAMRGAAAGEDRLATLGVARSKYPAAQPLTQDSL